jgi:hypothetical protein
MGSAPRPVLLQRPARISAWATTARKVTVEFLPSVSQNRETLRFGFCGDRLAEFRELRHPSGQTLIGRWDNYPLRSRYALFALRGRRFSGPPSLTSAGAHNDPGAPHSRRGRLSAIGRCTWSTNVSVVWRRAASGPRGLPPTSLRASPAQHLTICVRYYRHTYRIILSVAFAKPCSASGVGRRLRLCALHNAHHRCPRASRAACNVRPECQPLKSGKASVLRACM